MTLRSFILALASSTALSGAAFAQTAGQTPTDIGTIPVQQPIQAPAPATQQVQAPVQPLLLKKKKVVKKAVTAPVVTTAPATAPVAAASAATPSSTGVAAGVPLGSDQAVGSNAPVGSAPALALSQAPLSSDQPTSVVSDKVLRDVVVPSADYNEAAKYTPGFYSQNPNGPLGDSKSGWRGFADGQFDITYDGVPFGDANDPSHHSAAYFPGPFIGSVIIDRGPGEASTIGYAPFGGTMGLQSREFTDKAGSEVTGSVGSDKTYTMSATQQSGLVGDTHGLVQVSYNKTDGALDLANVLNYGILGKFDKKLGDSWKITLFGTFSREDYNNTANPSYQQLQQFGPNFAGLNNDPLTQEYIGYNNSQKRTDLEYIDLQGVAMDWQIDNKAYTYAYDYPALQNNGNNQNLIYPNTGTVTSVKITNPPSGCSTPTITCTTTINFPGVAAGDVTGYLKFNNYRAFGDTISVKKDINAGLASGQLRAGAWVEFVDNTRYQQYYDYTKGVLYTQLSPTLGASGATAPQNALDLANASYKLNLDSKIQNFQPWIEYEWKPTANLSITPGLKYESFERIHNAAVNQTTIQPASFDKTYTDMLPFLTARYKVNPSLTIYGQASKGFLAPTVSAFYVYDINNGGIAPQETTNYQVGAAYKSRLFTGSVDVYQITATNFPIVQNYSDGTTIYTNAGTAQYRGIEGEGTIAFDNGLGLTASGALSDARFIDGASTGLAVPNAPRYTAAGGVVYDKGHFFGSLLDKITGDQYGSGGQVATTSTINGDLSHIGSYNTTDFVIGFRTANKGADQSKGPQVPNYEFKLGVSNIFDNRNIVDIGGKPSTLTASDPANSMTYVTQAGRFVYGQVKAQF